MSPSANKSGSAPALPLLFYTGFAFLAAHELDAVAQSEWRLLPLLNLLDDATAQVVFIALHVPLFAAILWLAAHPRAAFRYWTQIAVDGFLIVHAGLHLALSGAALYSFHAALSQTLIYGGGLAGLVHLALLLRASRA